MAFLPFLCQRKNNKGDKDASKKSDKTEIRIHPLAICLRGLFCILTCHFAEWAFFIAYHIEMDVFWKLRSLEVNE
jgi:hypothetical protein